MYSFLLYRRLCSIDSIWFYSLSSIILEFYFGNQCFYWFLCWCSRINEWKCSSMDIYCDYWHVSIYCISWSCKFYLQKLKNTLLLFQLPTLLPEGRIELKRFILVNIGFLVGIVIMFILAIFEDTLVDLGH